MKDEQIRAQIHQAVDAHGEHLRTDPFLAQRIMNQERKGEPVVKKRLSVGLVLAIVMMREKFVRSITAMNSWHS